MFPAANIHDWLGKDIEDPEGKKLGTLESIYVDTTTDTPFFAGVITGIIGRHKVTFIPLTGATVSPDHLTVTVSKDLTKDAPSIDTDGDLSADQEPALFAHYHLDYTTTCARRLGRR